MVHLDKLQLPLLLLLWVLLKLMEPCEGPLINVLS